MEAAKGTQKAALAKDPDALFTAYDPLNEACFTWREAYRSCPTCQEVPPRGQTESHYARLE